jgi:hypothetical protein
MRSTIAAAMLLAAAASASQLSAQPGVTSNPPGVQGRDWDARSFRIGEGHAVTVTATNMTVNAHPGNTATVMLYVDGAYSGPYSSDSATVTKSIVVNGDGPHRAVVVCTNTSADADTCSLNVARVDEGNVF